MQTSRSILRISAWVVPFILLPAGGIAKQRVPPAKSPGQNSSAPQSNHPAGQMLSPNQPNPILETNVTGTNAFETVLVSRMHMIDEMEIAAGKLAAQKGSTFTMREYGNRLERDHKMADSRVLAYATAHKLSILPPGQIETAMQQIPQSALRAETTPRQMAQRKTHSLPSSDSPAPPAPGQALQQQIANSQMTMQNLDTLRGR